MADDWGLEREGTWEKTWIKDSSLAHRHKRSRLRSGVFRRGPDQAVVRALFHDVRRPARRAGNDKNGREQRRRNVAAAISNGAEEIEIGKNLLLAPHHRFDAIGDGKQVSVGVISGQSLREFLDGRRARVAR